MSILETIVVACGLSLDVCALMMCKGALLPVVSKGRVSRICVIFACFQMGALILGNLVGYVLLPNLVTDELRMILTTVAAFIFAGLGLCMLSKAWRNESVFESRKDTLETKEILLWAPAVSVDAFLAGLGYSFLRTQLLTQTITVGVVTVIAVVAGLQAGYMLGYEQKTKSYLAGGLLLVASGVELALRYI